MIPRAAIRTALAALALSLAACGWVEVEPEDPVRRSTARKAAPVEVVGGQRLVRVRDGDTLFGLANQHDATRRQLIVLNELAAPYDLATGQKLRLPAEQTLHRVRSGDTLGTIAESYRVDLNTLAASNYVLPPYIIRVGELIGVPNNAPRLAARPRPQAGSVQRETLPAAKPPPDRLRPPPPKPQPAANPTVAAKPPAKAAPAPGPKPKPQPKPAAAPRKVGPSAAVAGKSGGFLAPVEGQIIAPFGSQADGRRNDGVNIAAPKGAPVRAANSGKVVYAGDALQGYGNLILVRHDDGWVTAYAHLDRILAKQGDRVARGQTIGAVGSTGGVATPQLHFEMRRNNKAVDPTGRLAAN